MGQKAGQQTLPGQQQYAHSALAGLGACACLLLDANACTGNGPDWPVEEQQLLPPRNIVDLLCCPRGHRLLQLCQDLGLRICNGRGRGANPGAHLSFGVGGRSRAVVDFA